MTKSRISTIFKDRRLAEVFVLGIFSGLPLSVLFNTIPAWLSDANVGLELITTFAVARLSYSLKPLWAPAVDYFKVPGLHRLGRRKSWLIVCAAAISLVLFAMGRQAPGQFLSPLYFLAIALGFFSATYDIVFDGFRVEKFEPEEQGLAAVSVTYGYRVGIIIASAGALSLAHFTDSWPITFTVLSLIYSSAMLFILLAREEEIEREKVDDFSLNTIIRLVINPFKDFLKRDGALIILLTVILFKLGDTFLGIVSMPFYFELGFNKLQIGGIVKGWGLGATLLGTAAGGFLVYRLGVFKALILTGIIQSVNNLAFVWLHHQGADLIALAVAIFVENFGGAMGSAAMVAYLSMLCNKKYSATQYALFASSSSLINNTIVTKGGVLARYLGWDAYFILTVLLGLPAIALLTYLNARFKKSP